MFEFLGYFLIFTVHVLPILIPLIIFFGIFFPFWLETHIQRTYITRHGTKPRFITYHASYTPYPVYHQWIGTTLTISYRHWTYLLYHLYIKTPKHLYRRSDYPEYTI